MLRTNAKDARRGAQRERNGFDEGEERNPAWVKDTKTQREREREREREKRNPERQRKGRESLE